MRVKIVLLLIVVSIITVNAQDYKDPKIFKLVTTELLYSVTKPTTDFGVKLHIGSKWGGYAHARVNNPVINGFDYSLNNIGSVGVSYRLSYFIKPYIGVSMATQKRPHAGTPPPAVPVQKTGNYLGGETGFLLFIFNRGVIDIGFCYVIEPSVNLGIGLSF